jgi:hypothetical protein
MRENLIGDYVIIVFDAVTLKGDDGRGFVAYLLDNKIAGS